MRIEFDTLPFDFLFRYLFSFIIYTDKRAILHLVKGTRIRTDMEGVPRLYMIGLPAKQCNNNHKPDFALAIDYVSI